MNCSSQVYAGLDVGSSTCHVVVLDREGSNLHDQKFNTSEANLIQVFEGIQGQVQVHLEASELAGWIRRVLIGRVARVVVSHAKTIAWITKDPLKRDQVDAFKLADLLRMGRVHEVYYANDDERTVFKQIVRHYDDITDQETRLKRKIKARFRVQGVIPRGEQVFGEGRQGFLSQVHSSAAQEAIGQLYTLLDHCLQAQKDALKLMRRESRRYPEILLFDDVPGVGLIGACRFSAYIQTPHRFSSKRKLWRYCRLGITDRSSDGKSIGRQSLDFNGCGRLKDMSRKSFHGAMRTKKDNAFRRFYSKSLRATHDADHARLSTQRKILAVLRAMWMGGTKYSDDKG